MENDSKHFRSRRALFFWLHTIIFVIIGALFIWWSVNSHSRQLRYELHREIDILAKAIDPHLIKHLTGSSKDLTNPYYLQLKRNLTHCSVSYNPSRCVYLMGIKPDGNIFFYADSEGVLSKNYSPPGQVYFEASDELKNIFVDKRTIIEGPLADRWGFWISALTPIKDPHTGNTLAVVGFDINAAHWRKNLLKKAILPTCITLSLLLLITIKTFIRPGRIIKARSIEVAYALTCGLILTFMCTNISYSRDMNSFKQNNFDIAESKLDKFRMTVNIAETMEFRSIANNLHSSSKLSQSLFESYTNNSKSNSIVVSWQWAEPVKPGDTGSVEAALTKEMKLPWRIWPKNASDIKQTHYPVKYLSQPSNNIKLQGYDLASNISIRTTIDKSIQNRIPIAANQQSELPGYESSNILPVCWPVYNSDANKSLRGILIGLLQFDKLVLDLQNEDTAHSYAITIRDAQIAAPITSTKAPGSNMNNYAENTIRGFCFAFNKTFIITTTHKPFGLWNSKLSFSHIVALAGLITTGAVCIILSLTVNRQQQLENIVSQRTHELRQSQQRTETILNSLQDGVILVDAETHTILDANPAALEMLKSTEEDVIGHVCHRYVCPAEIGNCPITDQGQEVDRSEKKVLTSDGEEIPVFKTIVPITLNGKECLLESFIDISEQKKAEEHLARQAFQQQELAKFGQMALMDIPIDNFFDSACELLSKIFPKAFIEIMLYNQQRRTLLLQSGINWAEEFTGFKLHSDDICYLPGYCLRQSDPVICEDINNEDRFELHDLPGTHNVSSAMAMAIPGHPGPAGTIAVYYQNPCKFEKDQINFFISVANTMSAFIERKTMQDTLEHRVQQRTKDVHRLLTQKDGFVNRLGHDLKTPLTPLVSLLPLIHSNCKDEKTAKMLKLAIDSVQYMQKLVTRTLQLARLNNVEEQFEAKRLELSSLVKDAISTIEHQVQKKTIELNNKVENQTYIMGDETELLEVMHNLLSNAIKYSDGPGTITVNSGNDGDFLTISIKDTGIGMTKQQASRVFEEYYKADESRHDRSSIGLGLGICKRIIELHGGRIWVYSEGPGKGSTFSFTLPLAANTNSVTENMELLL